MRRDTDTERHLRSLLYDREKGLAQAQADVERLRKERDEAVADVAVLRVRVEHLEEQVDRWRAEFPT